MTPQFDDAAAGRTWSRYAARVDVALRHVDTAVATDLRRELLAHLRDGYEAAAGSEAERVAVAIARLGAPEEFLRPLLADSYIDQGTRGFAPVVLARGLGHEIARGGRAALVGLTFMIGYTMLAAFAAMALLQPVLPGKIGLFSYPDGRFQFGIVRDTAGSSEVLGLWTIPIALSAAGLLWWLLGRLLRRVRQPSR